MTVVIGTAGHIDHGKTTLLRALTGIDADRLPEERARGMTIDVGYAHMTLPDGDVLDFVDVPGHDRLIGNMLVGAAEVDAALLVVAADDGPRAQTHEHLRLIDALGIDHGIVVITKSDLTGPGDPRTMSTEQAVREIVAGTGLAHSPVIAVSASTGSGLDELRTALIDLRDAVRPEVTAREGPARLAIDRIFTIRGHGAVVTGSLRGGAFETGQVVRIEPGHRRARIREIQSRNEPTNRATGGRTALNLTGVDADHLHRGMVIVPADDLRLAVSDRLLVVLRSPARRSTGAWRLHLGTAEVGAELGRGQREHAELATGATTTLLRLDRPVAMVLGDRFALRSSSDTTAIGGRVIDPDPPRGPSRRRVDTDRLAALANAGTWDERDAARLDLHGSLVAVAGSVRLAPDVEAGIDAAAIAAVRDHHVNEPDSAGLSVADIRPLLARALRRRVTIDARAAGAAIEARLGGLVATGRLARDGDRLRDPSRPAGTPAVVLAAMDRLETRLAVHSPPPLAEAAREAGCPSDGVRALENAGRIVRLEPDLAYASSTFRELEALAVSMARAGPLTPAAYRDATDTSRRYVMALLEEFDRRGVLRRTDAGRVPGPRAAAT